MRIQAAAADADAAASIERFLSETLSANRWQKKLLHGVRDRLHRQARGAVPGRARLDRGLRVRSFGHRVRVRAGQDGGLAKIIFFYGLNDLAERSRQRIYRKKLWMSGRALPDRRGCVRRLRAGSWKRGTGARIPAFVRARVRDRQRRADGDTAGGERRAGACRNQMPTPGSRATTSTR
jgi:hypothetical protein